MSAGFDNLRVAAAGRGVDVSFVLRNNSDDTWRRDDGFSIGWQLFDPGGSAFLAEGKWEEAGEELQPGQNRAASIHIDLPEEDGEYHVFVSPLTAGAWHYAMHWPFILLSAAVEQGAARVGPAEVTTIGCMRRKGLGGRIRRALAMPAVTLARHRRLILSMARREMAARYRGSVGDVAWTILHPLLLMLTYFFVFGIVLRSRLGGDDSRSGFVLYFLAGMLPWLPFSDAVGRAPSAILDHRNFVKKLLFPLETLPVSQAVAALATEGFALLIFLVLLFATRGAPPVTVLWLPALLIPQFLLTLGVSWFLAALGVYLRDLGQIIGFLLTLVFFLTPICYPESALPQAARPILDKSPIFLLVDGYRSILLEAQAPSPAALAWLWLIAAAACTLGGAWFQKLRRGFADVI